MKIQYSVGNLLENVTYGHIVHGCNAQGVQGGGIAKAIRDMYPGNYDEYRRVYEEEGLILGYAYPYCPTTDLVIWNAITQEFYGNDGQRYVDYDALHDAFTEINTAIVNSELTIAKELHLPFIGSGLAGGNWSIIESIIKNTCTVPVVVWSLDGRMPNGSAIVNPII